VPIENSYHGTVVESVDLMREYEFEILDSYTHVINHCLAVNPGVKKFWLVLLSRLWGTPRWSAG